jgi:hypothetical protein
MFQPIIKLVSKQTLVNSKILPRPISTWPRLKPVDDVSAKSFALGDIFKNNEVWIFFISSSPKGQLTFKFRLILALQAFTTIVLRLKDQMKAISFQP